MEVYIILILFILFIIALIYSNLLALIYFMIFQFTRKMLFIKVAVL